MKDVAKRLLKTFLCVGFLLVLGTVTVCCNNKLTGDNGEIKDYTQIIMTYNYYNSSRLDDLDIVIEKMNEITRSELGVEVVFKQVNTQEAYTEYPLWLSQGQQIDLMLLNYQDITSYVDKNMLYPINDLLESDGRDICNIMKNGRELTSGTTIGDQIYGVTIPGDCVGTGGGLWIPKEYLDAISFPYHKNHTYTMQELDILFLKLKNKYPDKYPLGQITTDNTFSTYTFFKGNILGAGSSINMGYVSETGEVANFYESEEYYAFLSNIRKWYLDGYIYPDSALTNISQMDLLRAGIIMSIPLSSTPGMLSNSEYGEELVCLKTSVITYGPSSYRGVFWTIPSTSVEPEAAMKVLNLMYSDERIVNLLQWGVEGIHYEKVNVAKGIIAYTDGITEKDGGYYNELGLYGDQSLAYTMDYGTTKEEKQEYSSLAQPLGMEYVGFLFDTSQANVEITKVQEVLSRYLPALESGSVELTTTYTEFILEMKNAGIDKVIEQNQIQLEDWRTKRE